MAVKNAKHTNRPTTVQYVLGGSSISESAPIGANSHGGRTHNTSNEKEVTPTL
jgi:hypothetical protein